MAERRKGTRRRKRARATFEEQAYSNTLTLNALLELLSEKRLVGRDELLERVTKLQAETQAKRKPN